ncbi:MAG: hypothetical protein AB7K09_07240 [Planctomycetota bacterium]
MALAQMRNLVRVMVVVALLAPLALTTGCGGQSAGDNQAKANSTTGKDGAPLRFPNLNIVNKDGICPVTGKPVPGDQFLVTYNGKYWLVESEQAAAEFTANPSQFISIKDAGK